MTAVSRSGTPRFVPCPTCGRPASFDPANRWRPFCYERCRGADLGAWASESFRVPAAAPTDPDDDLLRPSGRAGD
jgi:endogenous inhibitor of DNA gyrase (YacG/DUF329 family)